eukprot:1138381-Pelagomonas_calceolata.AAC.2
MKETYQKNVHGEKQATKEPSVGDRRVGDSQREETARELGSTFLPKRADLGCGRKCKTGPLCARCVWHPCTNLWVNTRGIRQICLLGWESTPVMTNGIFAVKVFKMTRMKSVNLPTIPNPGPAKKLLSLSIPGTYRLQSGIQLQEST